MLNRTRTAAIVILLLSAFAFGFQLPGDWVVFKSAEGRFSIGMPKEPEAEVKDVDSAVGKLQMYSFTSSNSTAYFLASYGDYPMEPASDRRELVLDGVRDGVLKGLEGELIVETKIAIDGYPGREFTAKKTIDGVESVFAWRIYLVGRRLYQVAAVTTRANSSSPEVQKYFNSFRLME